MTSISGPDFITLLVRDLEASYKFYTDQIGLSESRAIGAHTQSNCFDDSWNTKLAVKWVKFKSTFKSSFASSVLRQAKPENRI
jgi:predicted lactoylglutathione lyase